MSHIFKEQDQIGCSLSSCLIWGSLVSCMWLVGHKYFLGSECLDSGVDFGLWTQAAKDLETHGLLV